MIRVKIDFYRQREKIKSEISPSQYLILRKIFYNTSEFQKKQEDFDAYGEDEAVLTSDELEFIPDDILEMFTFKPIKHTRFIDLSGRIKQSDVIEKAKSVFQVHLPSNDLLSVKQVDWLEDACTEDLQRKLKQGWRILAVCPQPSSRRPDYVLGFFPQYIEVND